MFPICNPRAQALRFKCSDATNCGVPRSCLAPFQQSIPLLLILLILLLQVAQVCPIQEDEEENFVGFQDAGLLTAAVEQQSAVTSLFGQVAKGVVYGGASLVRANSRLLCAALRRETELENTRQPTLFMFKDPHDRQRAFRIFSDDEITEELIEESRFDPRQMTIILVHGWLGGLDNELWLSGAKDVALRASIRGSGDEDTDYDNKDVSVTSASPFKPNVIVVDWSEFAHGSLYSATQNSLKVARRLGRLLEQLATVGRLKPELMHCLGHSIGAHICGQAARQAFPIQQNSQAASDLPLALATAARGQRRARMGRVTALDPGGFCYELNVRNETRYTGMKPSDALLVDAYYSNRSPFGNKYLVAHYNVRLNNGFFQGPCSVWRNSTVAAQYFRATLSFVLGTQSGRSDVLTCDHYFATRFAYQISSAECAYVGWTCNSYRNFVRGRCGPCDHSAASPATSCLASTSYSMDFEYQRSDASVEHALRHIRRHSPSFPVPQRTGGDDAPPGGVPYAKRKVFYMRASNEQPYCSYTYRVRVVLRDDLTRLESFRADSVELHLLSVVTLRDSSIDKLTSGRVLLYGPWQPLPDGSESNSDEQLSDEEGGQRANTLTGMFELKRPDRIWNIRIIYDNNRNRNRLSPLINPIDSVHIDYLSTQDEKIRSKYSSSFEGYEIEVKYRHLEEVAAAGAA